MDESAINPMRSLSFRASPGWQNAGLNPAYSWSVPGALRLRSCRPVMQAGYIRLSGHSRIRLAKHLIDPIPEVQPVS
jgi:hypothetical protein